MEMGTVILDSEWQCRRWRSQSLPWRWAFAAWKTVDERLTSRRREEVYATSAGLLVGEACTEYITVRRALHAQ